MEQRGAPAALRKVQQPQGHWLRCRGIEPEEKLQGREDTTSTLTFSDLDTTHTENPDGSKLCSSLQQAQQEGLQLNLLLSQ